MRTILECIAQIIFDFFVIFIILVLVSGLVIYSDTTRWNDGVCHECESGRYEEYAISSNRYGPVYVFKCDACGSVIEMTDYPQ